jgi:DNA-binding transcriptional regulator YiaG
LPFSTANQKVHKPLGDKYILNPKTIGDQIRNKRLRLGLLQKDLAVFMHVCVDTITYWENSRCIPKTKHHKRIIAFLEDVSSHLRIDIDFE